MISLSKNLVFQYFTLKTHKIFLPKMLEYSYKRHFHPSFMTLNNKNLILKIFVFFSSKSCMKVDTCWRKVESEENSINSIFAHKPNTSPPNGRHNDTYVACEPEKTRKTQERHARRTLPKCVSAQCRVVHKTRRM